MTKMYLVLLTALFAVVSADISASSPLGSSLLSKARRLNNGDDNYDFSKLISFDAQVYPLFSPFHVDY